MKIRFRYSPPHFDPGWLGWSPYCVSETGASPKSTTEEEARTEDEATGGGGGGQLSSLPRGVRAGLPLAIPGLTPGSWAGMG